MVSKYTQQEIDAMVMGELSRVREERGDEFAKGWLDGASWTIDVVFFFEKITNMKERYDERTAKEDTVTRNKS
jgi:hypothetical protein